MPTTTYMHVNGVKIGHIKDGVRTDYLTDALGSITATKNQSQQIVNTYRYKPYGALLAKTGTGEDPNYLWTGNTGSRVTNTRFANQYNVHRHYANGPAQWTTVDPLWPKETAYGYVNGSPTVYGDPAGLSCGHDCEKSCDAFFKANPDFCKHTPPSPPYPPNSVVMAVAFCCNGKPYQCFCPGQKPKNPYVLACVIVHERGHIIPGVSCPPGYTGIPSKFRIECEALKAGIKCAKEQCKNIISNDCIDLDEWRCFECRRLKDACSPMPPKSWLLRYCDGCGIL